MKIYLQEIRTKKNISIRKLSVMTGIARSYIMRIEKGKANPTLSVLCKLCKALEVNLSDLVSCD